ncbi:MAG: hypothetical protein KGD65_15330, partial [Candidatus Lokiarchaeota archaeon]|nr:hypothetical protein [Candidatus Lokiarchaeota archaeon]
MLKKSFKKKKLNTFLIILSLVLGFLQVINFSPKNQIFSDIDLFNEENANDINIAANVGSDWEVALGQADIALLGKPSGTQQGDLLIVHCTLDDEINNLSG